MRNPVNVDWPLGTPRDGDGSNTFQGLFKYLDGRYADVLVLTFGQIEDLIGATLPPGASTHTLWWTSDSAGPDAPAVQAWARAGRTARPNLSARTVTFERSTVPRPRG